MAEGKQRRIRFQSGLKIKKIWTNILIVIVVESNVNIIGSRATA